MSGSISLYLRVALILGGIFLGIWHPSAEWVEHAYANGVYPGWEHFIHAIAQPLPWSLGDLAALLGVALIIWRVVARLRASQYSLVRRIGLAVFDVAAIVGAYVIWFDVSWGWNYDRAPIEARVNYQASRVTPQAVDALRLKAIAEMNALAPLAHAHANDPLNIEQLRTSWLPTVQAAGDTWSPEVGAPKLTVAEPFMAATGTSGFINPLTLNSHLATDLLWFERPFSLAHEWSHVAAYAREDEANYLAIVTCLRSPDPVAQYSGWLELFLYLPGIPQYKHSTFVPLVWSDFDAIRKRNARHINLTLAHWSWRTYNVYLKSNRIASGVQNYDEVTRLVLGIPRDANGLPVR